VINRSRVSFLAIAMMLAACNDVPTTEAVATPQFDLESDCYIRGCTSVATLYPSTITLGQTKVAAFVISGGGLLLAKGATVALGVVGPSDTVPGPVPVGAVRAAYARFGDMAFRPVLQGLFAGGYVPPSDTVPAPPAPGRGYQTLSNGNVLVWLPVDQLKLSTATQALIVTLSIGNKVVYQSDAAPVGIIGPEIVVTH
jgi:hypothetical protein